MDENTEADPRNGNTILSSSRTRQNNQTLPNDTMNRTADRTCTRKLTIPTLEKHDHTSANLWWRKFFQYKKMTKEIDLWTMTNNKEILTQYRDQLEREIRYFHLGNWTKRYHGNDKNNQRKRTELTTIE